MAEQYIRKVIVDVFNRDTGQSTRIENLRVKFKVDKTPKSEPNQAEIEIYNLSPKTRGLFETKNCGVVLYAGYMGLNPRGLLGTSLFSSRSVELVFKGNVIKFNHEKDGTDLITKLDLGDGDNAFRNRTLDKGYPPDSRLSVPLNDIAAALGLPKGAQVQVPDERIGNGLTLSGMVRDHLDVLCDRYGLEWSIQDESLQIVRRGSYTDDGVVFLSKETGLIGSPNKTKDGVEFECLLQPALRPAKRVQLESNLIKGTFICRTVAHEGDSHEGDFLTKVQAKI